MEGKTMTQLHCSFFRNINQAKLWILTGIMNTDWWTKSDGCMECFLPKSLTL